MSSGAHRGSIRYSPPSPRARGLARDDPSAAGAMTPHPRGRLPTGMTGQELSETMPPEPWRCSDVLRRSSSHERARLALLHGKGPPLLRPRATRPFSGAARSWRAAHRTFRRGDCGRRGSSERYFHFQLSHCVLLASSQIIVSLLVVEPATGSRRCLFPGHRRLLRRGRLPGNRPAVTSTSSCHTAM